MCPYIYIKEKILFANFRLECPKYSPYSDEIRINHVIWVKIYARQMVLKNVENQPIL